MRRRRLAALGVALMLALASVDPAQAERSRGMRLAAEGRCRGALQELAETLAARPEDAEVLLLVGTCQARLGRHAEAIASLERARALDPTLPGVDLRLAASRFHLGDLEAAEAALDAADAAGGAGASAESLLYRGLILLERGADAADAAEAARLLDAAARHDPSLAPAAGFYAGLAHRAAGEEALAQARLRSVVARYPATSWADSAERALAVPDERTPLWAELMGGIEYDDNVILRGEGVALPSEISSERDVRGVWTAAVGGTLYEDVDTVVNGRVTYFGRAHRDLHEFDAHYPTISAWVDQRLLPTTWLRGQLVFGYGWVDGAPFVSSQEADLSLVHDWPGDAISSLGVELYRDNYRFSNVEVPDGPQQVGAPCLDPSDLVCGPPGLDESRARNRDGNGFVLRADHAVSLGRLLASLDLGYRFRHFSARGRDYSFDAHELRMDGVLRLPLAFDLALGGLYAYRPYRHPTTFPSTEGLQLNRRYALPERRRRDRTVEVWASLSRPIFRRTVLSVGWSYVDNHSSEDVFDYERHIVGAYLTIRLGGE